MTMENNRIALELSPEEQEAVEAEKFADESPFPAPEEAFEDMYAA